MDIATCSLSLLETINVNNENETYYTQKIHWQEKESIEQTMKLRTQRCNVKQKNNNAMPIGQRANSPVKAINRYVELNLIDWRIQSSVKSTDIFCMKFVCTISCLASVWNNLTSAIVYYLQRELSEMHLDCSTQSNSCISAMMFEAYWRIEKWYKCVI